MRRLREPCDESGRVVIEVVAYDEAWVRQFAMLRESYADALRDVPVVAIEHVGSTSVPGLAAKPVIDVDIVVAESDVAAAIAALESIGYESVGTLGIPQRWAFRAPDGGVRTHTYVVVDGSLAVRNHLAVRDVLRADRSLRDQYAALKVGLAEELDGSDAYVVAKSGLLQDILERAGLSVEDRRAIDRQNSV